MKTALPKILLYIIVVASLQSCNKSYFEASIDFSKHHRKELYSFFDNSSVMANLMINYHWGLDEFRAKSGLGQFSRSQPSSTALLASAKNEPSLAFNDRKRPVPAAFALDRFQLMPGIELIGKGTKAKGQVGTEITRMLYLNLPVYMLYRYPLPNDHGEILGGLGPYFAYGLTGKLKYIYNVTEEFSAFDKDNGGFKRFDSGLAFTAGYQLPNGLRVRLGYQLGLVNIDPLETSGKIQNRTLSLNFGYPVSKMAKLFSK